MTKKKVVEEDVQQEEDEVVELAPVDAAQDVSQGDTVTVTLPLAAALVLANPDGQKLAEVSDAAALLRAELA